MSISIKLSTNELTRRLKDLIDIVADPDAPILDPAKYSKAYARLLNLITTHPDKMKSHYVLHNLGAARVDFLSELTGQIYVRPEYRKSKTLKTLRERDESINPTR